MMTVNDVNDVNDDVNDVNDHIVNDVSYLLGMT